MITSMRLGGWAIVTATLLEFIKFIPIFLIEAANIPPSDIADIVEVTTVGRRGWEFSHLLGQLCWDCLL